VASYSLYKPQNTFKKTPTFNEKLAYFINSQISSKRNNKNQTGKVTKALAIFGTSRSHV